MLRSGSVIVVSAAVLALAFPACSSEQESPQPDADQIATADRALGEAREALAAARSRLQAEPGAAQLTAAITALRRAAALLRAAGAGVDAAILAEGDVDSVRQALSEAERFVDRAVDEGLRANEAVLDAADLLGVAPDELIDPRTDTAIEQASAEINEASTEVAVAAGAAGA